MSKNKAEVAIRGRINSLNLQKERSQSRIKLLFRVKSALDQNKLIKSEIKQRRQKLVNQSHQ